MKMILVAAALAALALAGCTPAEESTAVAGVNAACSAAAIGSTVYVQVESSAGESAQTISKQVSSDVAQDCPVLTAAAQAAIAAVANTGATATVSVSTSTPKSAKRRLVAKVRLKSVGGQMSATFIVKPDFVLPFVGAL